MCLKMSDKKKMSKPYFSHDIASRGDIKIKRLIHEQGFEGYGLFWAVVEFLHENELCENDIEVLADDFNIPAEKLEKVLKTDLFVWEDGKIFSKRVQKNLEIQQEKAEKAKNAIKNRWKKFQPQEDFSKSVINLYKEIFQKEEIILSDENKQLIKDISDKNSITIELWKKVFENAKRGWNLSDGSHKIPSLQTILGKWDSFANDDYYLAPERKKTSTTIKQEEFIDETNFINSKSEAIKFIAANKLSPKNPVCKKLMKDFTIEKKEIFPELKGADNG